ncbi:MAG: hypothetical protein US40_C0007G0058 [Candidatus Roizmanbacteria bacterium GW2011_GWC2_37_13]|uniref:Uncharacterized protein n=1 Tax=Candidatus Roizmanbacteria bacterium GW2011_GWC2_37_13 TaxID=1618486 RepID=A0A0G0IMX8_9BACT|nr:MAG: hypothetical protein US38_C0012G0061 [Candidatus Roizmanbacteria bacterium GW2011_GWC1_37_12]KKQ25559.1 MAG: hypothetical protein US40_C0007G0058 [Candidatus Roizmanbacteria bacterium GW2011_GWC2_37_13]
MTITIDDITVKIKLLKSETILAQATIILSDVWKEHGWKVLKSDRLHPKFQEYLWFQAPSYKFMGKYWEIVFIDDNKLYEAVIEKIYDAYCLARSKNPTQNEKEETITEEVSLDDIDL